MRVCFVFVVVFFTVLWGCGGGAPPDYSEPESGTGAEAGTGVPSGSSGSSGTVSQPSGGSGGGSQPSSGGEYTPGAGPGPGMDEMSKEDYALSKKLYEDWQRWTKEADPIIKAFQDGQNVDVGRARALAAEGASIAAQAQDLASRLAKSTNARISSMKSGYENMAEEILNRCNALRDIMVGGR